MWCLWEVQEQEECSETCHEAKCGAGVSVEEEAARPIKVPGVMKRIELRQETELAQMSRHQVGRREDEQIGVYIAVPKCVKMAGLVSTLGN